MRVLVALSILMMLALAGCSGPSFYWYSPDQTLDQAKADYLACQDQARRKAEDMINEQHYDRLPPTDNSSPVTGSLTERARYADPGDTQDAWRQRYEQSVITDGMRAKGYLRLGADRVPPDVRTEKLSEGAVAGR
jgi:type II secretory pathway pseudopilin PulG